MVRTPAESAITAFEAGTGLSVVVHDVGRHWWSQLSPQRGHHHQALCRAVKQSVYAPQCLTLELEEWRAQWRRWPEGRLHRCHAGLLEWVVPLVAEDALLGVVFAGQRHAANDVVTADAIQRSSGAERLWKGARQQPLKVDADEAWRILELVRQLAARLVQLGNITHHVALPMSGSDRWARCERFLHEHHARSDLRLVDLARHLGLSESRLAHLFQERGGGSFIARVTAIRLQSAADYLRRTDMSISDVATSAGFGDTSHFHRVFRNTFGCTPLQFRRDADS